MTWQCSCGWLIVLLIASVSWGKHSLSFIINLLHKCFMHLSTFPASTSVIQGSRRSTRRLVNAWGGNIYIGVACRQLEDNTILWKLALEMEWVSAENFLISSATKVITMLLTDFQRTFQLIKLVDFLEVDAFLKTLHEKKKKWMCLLPIRVTTILLFIGCQRQLRESWNRNYSSSLLTDNRIEQSYLYSAKNIFPDK